MRATNDDDVKISLLLLLIDFPKVSISVPTLLLFFFYLPNGWDTDKRYPTRAGREDSFIYTCAVVAVSFASDIVDLFAI